MRNLLFSLLKFVVMQKVCEALHNLLVNIFIRFGSKLRQQIVGILMGIVELLGHCIDGTS